MGATLQQFLARVATRQRVVLIGGLAVIAHGYSRPTKDGDAWLDPLGSPESWARRVRETLREFPETRLWSLAERRALEADELASTAEIDGVFRVHGLNGDLDLFYRPNGLQCADFEAVWQRGAPWAEEVRVMDALDLLLTKESTGRDQDQKDVFHLEGIVRRGFGERLLAATPAEARAIFDRYIDHVVAEQALKNPDPAVRALAREVLEELAAQGDPFARDLLEKLARES